MKELLAYLASAAIGSAIMELSSAIRSADTNNAIFAFLVYYFILSMLILPFWVALATLLRRTACESPLLYGLGALVIGNLVGPTASAALPQMMWDTGPQLDYAGRWARAFSFNLLTFSIAGLAAGLTYGLIVCWPLRGHNRLS